MTTRTEGARCEWCATEAEPGLTDCARCGGPVDVLEPWVIDCGWCSSPNRRDLRAACERCGGPLPTIPGAHPGPRPPDVPRALPRGYRWRVRAAKNVHTIVGVAFTLTAGWTMCAAPLLSAPFGFALLFALGGIPVWIHGHRRAERTLDALVHGTPTRGRILSVKKDLGQELNGRNPWIVAFEYDTASAVRPGEVLAWDPAHLKRPKGEHVWVVHRADDPAVHALWPPIH